MIRSGCPSGNNLAEQQQQKLLLCREQNKQTNKHKNLACTAQFLKSFLINVYAR